MGELDASYVLVKTYTNFNLFDIAAFNGYICYVWLLLIKCCGLMIVCLYHWLFWKTIICVLSCECNALFVEGPVYGCPLYISSQLIILILLYHFMYVLISCAVIMSFLLVNCLLCFAKNIMCLVSGQSRQH